MLRVAPARPLAFFAFYRRRLRFHHRYPHLFSFLFPLWNVIPTFGVDAVPTFASLFRTSPVPSIAFSSPRLARGVSPRRLSLSLALGSALIVDPRVGARDGAHGVTEKLQVGTRFHRRRARDFGCRNGCRRAAGPGRAHGRVCARARCAAGLDASRVLARARERAGVAVALGGHRDAATGRRVRSRRAERVEKY